MEANKLEKQAQAIARHLMSDKDFNNKVAVTARTKHDGTFSISSDQEFYQLQMLLCDAFAALNKYTVLGQPIGEEDAEIIAQCLTELHRLSNFEWMRWADSVPGNRTLAN